MVPHLLTFLYIVQSFGSVLSFGIKLKLIFHSIAANANAARRALANLNANQNDYANTFGNNFI